MVVVRRCLTLADLPLADRVLLMFQSKQNLYGRLAMGCFENLYGGFDGT